MSESTIATVADKPNVDQLLAKMGDKKLKLGDRINTIGEIMKATSGRMLAALPKHVTPDRMIKVALNALRRNPKLLECSAPSLFGAITEAATYGWEIGGILGHAYLVPFRNECQLIPGYKGLIDLCRRSGQVSTIMMEVVHKGDEFSYSLGDDPHINHRPNDKDPQRDKKPITYVYAVVRLRDGGVQRSVWSTERVDSHKEQYSKAWQWAQNGDPHKGGSKKDSFWHTNWPAAAKKTVIRDMINRGLIPVSAEYRDVVDRGLQRDADELEFATFDMVPNDDQDGSAFGITDESMVEASQVAEPETPKDAQSPPVAKKQNGSAAPSSGSSSTDRPLRTMTPSGCRAYIEDRWEEESKVFEVEKLSKSASGESDPRGYIDSIIRKQAPDWESFSKPASSEDSQEAVNDGPSADDVDQSEDVPDFVSNPAPRPKRMDEVPSAFEKSIITKKSPEVLRKLAGEEIPGNPDLVDDEQAYLISLASRRAWQLEHNKPTTDRLTK
jgi:recombination protein RecT